MNQFTQSPNPIVKGNELTEEQLLDHFIEQSQYTDLDDLIISNLSYHDAMEFVQATDDFANDAIEHLDYIGKLPLHIPSITDLVHHLAYSDPAEGTALLNELLYYHEQGRI